MSSYDFIIDNIRFSYSSTSTFGNCAYGYKLTYIDAMPRENNFYAEYGTLIHECLEKYFSGELEMYDLSKYYEDNYNLVVKTPPPPNPPGMNERYKKEGSLFFDLFYFDKSDYEILLVEDKIDFNLTDSIKFVAKPDLVLKEKATGKIILYDYKTSAPFRIDKRNGKEIVDNKKIDGYYTQMFTYTYALRNYKDMPIDEITLWFPRMDRKVSIPWSLERENQAISWIEETINKIKDEEDFKYNNSNSYFCNNLCSVKTFCEYR